MGKEKAINTYNYFWRLDFPLGLGAPPGKEKAKASEIPGGTVSETKTTCFHRAALFPSASGMENRLPLLRRAFHPRLPEAFPKQRPSGYLDMLLFQKQEEKALITD